MTAPMASAPDKVETKWTPGPYHADGPDPFGDWNILHNGDALAVAAVVSNLRHPHVVAANARLIAAAPEMAEVLLRLVEGTTDIDAIYEDARSVLAMIDGDDECTSCDGEGKVWNNADPTSGQWVACEVCGVSS